MKTIYISQEQAMQTHRKTIEYSGVGSCSELNIGYLSSALELIQNDDLLTEIIHSFLENEDDFCEELKLKILLAIDDQEVGFNEN